MSRKNVTDNTSKAVQIMGRQLDIFVEYNTYLDRLKSLYYYTYCELETLIIPNLSSPLGGAAPIIFSMFFQRRNAYYDR